MRTNAQQVETKQHRLCIGRAGVLAKSACLCKRQLVGSSYMGLHPEVGSMCSTMTQPLRAKRYDGNPGDIVYFLSYACNLLTMRDGIPFAPL